MQIYFLNADVCVLNTDIYIKWVYIQMDSYMFSTCDFVKMDCSRFHSGFNLSWCIAIPTKLHARQAKRIRPYSPHVEDFGP